MRPIIQAGTLQMPVVEAETQPTNQMQPSPGGRTESGDITGVRRNLRLKKRNVQHVIDVAIVAIAQFPAAVRRLWTVAIGSKAINFGEDWT